MTDLNVALILRLMDQFSGPAGKVREAVRGMGNSAKEFRQAFGAQIRAGFSEANIEAALAKNEVAIARARGRLVGAFGMGLTLAAPVMASAKMERDLIGYGNLAGLTGEKVRALGADLSALSRRDQTGMSSGQLLAGLETYVGKGLDQEAAMKALLATGRAAKATRSEFDLMAASGFAVMDNLGVAPDQLRKVFDVMAQGGKSGGFELKDMANSFPEITAAARALGIEGVDGVASLTAALQVAVKSAGSTDQAANNFSNFMGKLTSPDTVKKFAEFGVDVQAELNKAVASGADPLEHMLSVIERVTGGDQFKMGELFADKQVLDFLRAAIPNLEEYRRIKQEALAANGIVDKDFAAEMTGFEENVTQLGNAFGELFSASGVLLPILTDIAQGATEVIYAISDWTKANPALTEAIVKGGAALLAFGVGTRVLGYGMAVLRGGLIRTAAMFLKYDSAGRNVSVAARAVRGLGWALGGLGKLGKISLRGLIVPLRWGAKLIPRIPWLSLVGGKFALRALITALKWTTRLIPVIGWALLAGELLWHLLIKPLGWDKYLPSVDWSKVIGAFSWDGWLPRVDWSLILSAISWPEWVGRVDWATLLPEWSWKLLIPPLAIAEWLGFSWSDVLPDWNWSDIIPDLPSFSFDWFGGAKPAMAPAGYVAPNFRAMPPVSLSAPGSMQAAAAWLDAPRVATRSDNGAARMATPPPAAPVQRVEETVNHDYRSEQSITVTVPVQIMSRAEVDYARISREVGARTEAATRRALSDHGGPQ